MGTEGNKTESGQKRTKEAITQDIPVFLKILDFLCLRERLSPIIEREMSRTRDKFGIAQMLSDWISANSSITTEMGRGILAAVNSYSWPKTSDSNVVTDNLMENIAGVRLSADLLTVV